MTICQNSPLPPWPALLEHFYPTALETELIQGWEAQEGTESTVCALQKSQASSYELAVTPTFGITGVPK